MATQMGEIIRSKREEFGSTQEQLAEKIGKSPGYIGQLERGLSTASFSTLKPIINALLIDANVSFYEQYQTQRQCNELDNILSSLDVNIQDFIKDSIYFAYSKRNDGGR